MTHPNGGRRATMCADVGLFDRFGASKAERSRKAARGKELAGNLEAAVELYLEASLPDEAARVLLLRADGEPALHRRVMFCDLAARTAADEGIKTKARLRKARLAFDMLKAAGAARAKSELVAVARDLEEVGELEAAAEAFALAGDQEGEVRALTAAGAIEKLEERLKDAAAGARAEREKSVILSRVTDLDRTGERREALR
ncbi:MAG TPA: FHA domain-containing protein, partial [Polyangiaceae bacterium]|nr:FHA domain-containing protein [Polyangiaceae bacterium]